MPSKKVRLKRILDALEPPSDLKKGLRKFKEKVKESIKEQDQSMYRVISPFVERVRSVEIGNNNIAGKINELYATVDFLRSKPDFNPQELYQAIEAVEDSIIVFQENVEMYVTSDEINKTVKELRDDLEFLHKGGGSMNRQIKVNGVDYLTKYTDINLIGGITAVDNNTLKRVDITFSSSGGVSLISYTGAVNGVNDTFVFSTAPNIIVRDNASMRKVESDGTVNWTGTTTVVLAQPPNRDLFAF